MLHRVKTDTKIVAQISLINWDLIVILISAPSFIKLALFKVYAANPQ